MNKRKKIITAVIMILAVIIHIIIFIPAITDGLGIYLLSFADDMGLRSEYIDWESFCFDYCFHVPFTFAFLYFICDMFICRNAEEKPDGFDKASLLWGLILAVLFVTGFLSREIYWYIIDFETVYEIEYPFIWW